MVGCVRASCTAGCSFASASSRSAVPSSLSSTKQISKRVPASAALTRSTRGWMLPASLRVGMTRLTTGAGPRGSSGVTAKG